MTTAVQTITPEDQAFVDAFRAQTGLTNFGKDFPKFKTYAEKLKYVRKFYTDSKTPAQKQVAIDEGIKWLKANNPDILDQNGNPFKDGFYADIISGDATTQKTNTATLDAARKTIATDYVGKTLDAKGTLGAAARAAEIAKITQGTKTDPYNPTKLSEATSAVRGTAAYTPGTKTFDQLKATYGGLLNPSGKPVFSDDDLNAVANAKTLGAISNFNNKLNSLADSVLKAQGSSYVTADPAEIQASRQALFKDPTTFVTSVNGLNKTNKTNLGTPNTLTGGSGIDTLTPAKSLKTWKAPQQGVATANSPYSGLLDATLAKVTGANFGTPTNNAVYKNLTDPLTQGMGIDSLSKPKVTYDDTAKAGITGLGDVSGTLQPLNTQVTSTPTYNSNQIANANTALDNAAIIADRSNPVNPPVNPPVKTPAELAAEKFAVDKASYMNSFNARDYIDPQNRTRSDILTQAKTDPKLAANLDWSAQLDKSPADFTSKVGMTAAEVAAANKIAAEKQAALGATTNTGIGSLTQGTDVVNQQAAEKAAIASQANLEASAQNAGYGGDLTDTAAVQDFLKSEKVDVQDYTGKYAKQQAIDKAEADRQAGLVALANQQAAEKAAIANTLFQQGNITAMPTGVAATGSNVFEKPPSTGGVYENVSLPTNTVALTPSGPPSATVGPISAAQNNLGPLNIANLGAVIGPQAMNSNAGGIPSLMGPFPNTGATVQQQPAVIQQPAVTQQPVGVSGNTSPLFIPPDTRVFDTAGNVVAGKRKLFV